MLSHTHSLACTAGFLLCGAAGCGKSLLMQSLALHARSALSAEKATASSSASSSSPAALAASGIPFHTVLAPCSEWSSASVCLIYLLHLSAIWQGFQYFFIWINYSLFF